MTTSVIFTIYKELLEDSDGYKEITDICLDTHKRLAKFHGFDYRIISEFDIPSYVKVKLDSMRDARTPNNQFLPMNSFTDILRNKFTVDLHNTYDDVIYLDSDFLVTSNNLLNNKYDKFSMAYENLLDLDISSSAVKCKLCKRFIQNYMHYSTKSDVNLIRPIMYDQEYRLSSSGYSVKGHTDLGVKVLSNYNHLIGKILNAGGFSQSMYVYFMLKPRDKPSDLYKSYHGCDVDGYNLCLSALNKNVFGVKLTPDIYKQVIYRMI